MAQAATVFAPEPVPAIAAVVTICSSRKRAPAQAHAGMLDDASQADIASAWLGHLRLLEPNVAAAELYGGRAFGLAKAAAAGSGAAFFVISAGLGLVPGTRRVPSYDLTVAGGRGSVSALTKGAFNPSAWFRSISAGPYGAAWDAVFPAGSGLVLVALTRPYARMVGPDLANLDSSTLGRLRLFGIGIAEHLPVSLLPMLMPYDERLDAITPGTKADFAQRALADFATHVAALCGNAPPDWHANAIRQRLKDVQAPERPDRPRLPDDEIEALIRARLRSGLGIQRTLRALRDQDGVACEQARFRRLYWKAMAAEGLS